MECLLSKPKEKQKSGSTRHRWLMPVIPATLEGGSGGLQFKPAWANSLGK
jgi:hypothetical protein